MAERADLWAMVRAVQATVLPCYGCDASHLGVQDEPDAGQVDRAKLKDQLLWWVLVLSLVN